jgi:NAD(P)H-hydrate epimerase
MGLPGLTKEQMVEVDRIMMEELHVPVELMMEHAGLSLARTAVTVAGSDYPDFVVIVGPGNNGGGGLVAARRLNAWGQRVKIIVPKGVEGLRPVPRRQLTRVLSSGAEMTEGVPDSFSFDAPSLLIDAYLGYGFSNRNDPISDAVFDFLSRHPSSIALDAPSGLDVTTGESVSGLIPKVTLTVAFVKMGLLSTRSENVGRLLVCDIGVPISIFESRLGIVWSPPLRKESLSNLALAFADNPIQEVESLSVEGDYLCWRPKM